ncbi:hypothetical protein IEE92_13635 [Kocuria sp. cx-116]|nr:hypothetical protein [Kocuria sp. cx-116]
MNGDCPDFRWHGNYAGDGQIVNTLTSRGSKPLDPTRVDRRAESVWSPAQYPQAWRAAN